ncbi:hypothetical protein PZ938_10160 [Luteipulveratus sp. YIM 133132]|uniref:hypothetical protein n=1 Tax=Luteipulveratus flavus TaxID=3031728 RepID=UPI0023B100FE|nr:hypothetical protein [Luteipulveratus sp. YIM 133132]MDE9365966.1 hypothetical protein [Luteipulveratus sp. YIM 133132]
MRLTHRRVHVERVAARLTRKVDRAHLPEIFGVILGISSAGWGVLLILYQERYQGGPTFRLMRDHLGIPVWGVLFIAAGAGLASAMRRRNSTELVGVSCAGLVWVCQAILTTAAALVAAPDGRLGVPVPAWMSLVQCALLAVLVVLYWLEGRYGHR